MGIADKPNKTSETQNANLNPKNKPKKMRKVSESVQQINMIMVPFLYFLVFRTEYEKTYL